MSATNQTSTIGLSQYISTDKPTYLVDYNSDMLKIDNAIAADRESIADVNTVAERADGKADTNKSSIDTLNEQINGDPDVPSDTGIAGKVSALEGNVNTINSLIGNGSPTTSDQTIIGAVNGLEGSLAPREDGADLANSYAIGEQFARGGSVYTALTSLTAGTAFASLTLNTDYKVSDTLVEQIADAVSDTQALAEKVNGGYLFKESHLISITADTTKTVAENLAALYSAAVDYVNTLPTTYKRSLELILVEGRYIAPRYPSIKSVQAAIDDVFCDTVLQGAGYDEVATAYARLRASNCIYALAINGSDDNWTKTNYSNVNATAGTYSLSILIYQ